MQKFIRDLCCRDSYLLRTYCTVILFRRFLLTMKVGSQLPLFERPPSPSCLHSARPAIFPCWSLKQKRKKKEKKRRRREKKEREERRKRIETEIEASKVAFHVKPTTTTALTQLYNNEEEENEINRVHRMFSIQSNKHQLNMSNVREVCSSSSSIILFT